MWFLRWNASLAQNYCHFSDSCLFLTLCLAQAHIPDLISAIPFPYLTIQTGTPNSWPTATSSKRLHGYPQFVEFVDGHLWPWRFMGLWALRKGGDSRQQRVWAPLTKEWTEIGKLPSVVQHNMATYRCIWFRLEIKGPDGPNADLLLH